MYLYSPRMTPVASPVPPIGSVRSQMPRRMHCASHNGWSQVTFSSCRASHVSQPPFAMLLLLEAHVCTPCSRHARTRRISQRQGHPSPGPCGSRAANSSRRCRSDWGWRPGISRHAVISQSQAHGPELGWFAVVESGPTATWVHLGAVPAGVAGTASIGSDARSGSGLGRGAGGLSCAPICSKWQPCADALRASCTRCAWRAPGSNARRLSWFPAGPATRRRCASGHSLASTRSVGCRWSEVSASPRLQFTGSDPSAALIRAAPDADPRPNPTASTAETRRDRQARRWSGARADLTAGTRPPPLTGSCAPSVAAS